MPEMPAESAQGLPEEIPHRELRDPSALRALAHPVRLRILEELLDRGAATATELAERVGESPASCSWHLRQLARYGFIEDAGGGAGRQRPWRVVFQSVSFGDSAESGSELSRAEDAAADVLLDREVEALRGWHAYRHRDGSSWRAASSERQNRTWLTADELAAFTAELGELVERHQRPHLDRIDPSRRPTGCRPVHIVAWAIPGGPDTETSRSDQ